MNVQETIKENCRVFFMNENILYLLYLSTLVLT